MDNFDTICNRFSKPHFLGENSPNTHNYEKIYLEYYSNKNRCKEFILTFFNSVLVKNNNCCSYTFLLAEKCHERKNIAMNILPTFAEAGFNLENIKTIFLVNYGWFLYHYIFLKINKDGCVFIKDFLGNDIYLTKIIELVYQILVYGKLCLEDTNNPKFVEIDGFPELMHFRNYLAKNCDDLWDV